MEKLCANIQKVALVFINLIFYVLFDRRTRHIFINVAILILIGIYTFAQIFLFGAVFTKVYASTYGSIAISPEGLGKS